MSWLVQITLGNCKAYRRRLRMAHSQIRVGCGALTKEANQKGWLGTAVPPLFAVLGIFRSRAAPAIGILAGEASTSPPPSKPTSHSG